MIEKTYSTKDGDIHYWISDKLRSDRITLIFLHGLTASHELFTKQTEYFFEKYNVFSWDAPAHGKSRPYKEFTYEKTAVVLHDILKENAINKAVFIGQSMGGFIAQSVIKRFPEMVMAFVSIDSTPFGEKYYSKSDKWWLNQIEWMAKLYPFRMLKDAIAKQVSTQEDSYRNMLQMLSVYEKNELCHLMQVGEAGFLDDNCNLDIQCPVLLIVGRKDKTGKVIQYNQEWSKTIGVPVTWIDDAVHNSNDDQPEQVNSVIESFLGEIASIDGIMEKDRYDSDVMLKKWIATDKNGKKISVNEIDVEGYEPEFEDMIRSFWKNITSFDNQVQQFCMDSCEKSGEDAKNYAVDLVWIALEADGVEMGYWGRNVNIELRAICNYQNEQWTLEEIDFQ